MNIHLSKTAAEIEALADLRGVKCDAQRFVEHAADLHVALTASNEVKACFSLWWKNAPPHASEKLGVIGHFNAMDPEAVHLVKTSMEILRSEGCTLAVGPMDGNTWHSYRFVTEPGTEPPYFLEPQNPPEWPLYFEQAGFTPLAQYYSALNTNLAAEDPRMQSAEQRCRDTGITIRQATRDSLTHDLDSIFHISLESFAHNFLYTPISREAFIEQYHRGTAVDTVILKTVAILPDASLRGLGSVLVARLHAVAHELGYKRVIHALMHESNTSLNISRHYATVMRRYTLYARSLRA